MENQTSLIKQDVLAVVIQEFEREHQEHIAKLQIDKKTKLDRAINHFVHVFLSKKFHMSYEGVVDIMKDATSRLKIEILMIKNLKKLRLILRILELGCGSIVFISLLYHFSFLFFLMMFLPLSMCSLVAFSLYSLVFHDSKINHGMINGPFYSIGISKCINRLKERVANLEAAKQKLIEIKEAQND